jgi:hypothetical protein
VRDHDVLNHAGVVSVLGSSRLQAADQFRKRVGHRVLLHLIALDLAVFSFDVQRLPSVASHGNPNQSDGITVLVRIAACDTRDGASASGATEDAG